MIVNKNRYAIATKERPVKFLDDCNYQTDDIEDAELFFEEEYANDQVKEMDYPDKFEVLKVVVTYEL